MRFKKNQQRNTQKVKEGCMPRDAKQTLRQEIAKGGGNRVKAQFTTPQEKRKTAVSRESGHAVPNARGKNVFRGILSDR